MRQAIRAVFFGAAIAVAGWSVAVAADDAERIAKAKEMVALSLTDEILGDMAARTGRQLGEQINAQIAPSGKSLSQVDKDELIVRFSTSFVNQMKALEPLMVSSYAAELTERELDLLLEVYSDPEMAAVMAKMPVVMERMMPAIAETTNAIMGPLLAGMKQDGFLSNL